MLSYDEHRLTTVAVTDTSTVLGRMNKQEHALLTDEMTDLFASLVSHRAVTA